MIKFVATLLVALSMTGLAVTESTAKPLGKILRQSGLSPADFDLLAAAEKSLYETSSPRVGRKVSWTNPETQSHGTVRLAAIRKNCAYIQHFVYPQGSTKSEELRLRMCKSADGRWLLAP